MLKETDIVTGAAKIQSATIITREQKKPLRDAGLVAGTLVETAAGWRPVELLRVGDHVQTLDGGLRQVKHVGRSYYGADQGGYVLDHVLHVPGGAIGNCDAMVLMPEQMLMIESRIADDLLGTPLVLLPALALSGYRGIRRVRAEGLIEAVTLGFESEEIVYANTGVLLHCAAKPVSGFFTVLDHERGRALVSLLDRDARVLDIAMAKMAAEPTRKQAA